MTILAIPAAFNHRFTLKALIFCPETSIKFIKSLSIKKVQAIKVAKILT